VVNAISLVTVCVPALLNPLIVTGLAPGCPAMSTLVMEKTPLANSKVALEDNGIPALGVDGAAGSVGLDLKPLQTKPWYVVRISSSAKSSKLITPILTKTSPPPAEDPFELLFDFMVGALDESFDPLESEGDLVFLEALGPLVDFKVEDFEDLGLFKSLAMTVAQRTANRRNRVLREFIVAGHMLIVQVTSLRY
jgi:hypothetical protein